MSDFESDILYRPQLGVPPSYYSDGKLVFPEEEPAEASTPSIKEDLIKEVAALKNLLLFVPGAIRPQTESILNLVHFLLILIDEPEGHEGDKIYDIIKPNKRPDVIKPSIDDNQPYVPPSPDNPSDDSLDEEETIPLIPGIPEKPNIITDPTVDSSNPIVSLPEEDVNTFFKDHTPITIKKEKVPESSKISRFYSRSTLEISQYYIDRLNSILADYHRQIFAYPDIVDYLEEIYKTPLIDYDNYTAHSILQTLLKSQQEKISKMRLYQKLYNAQESVTCLKSLEYSKMTLMKNISHAPEHPKLYYKHLQFIETEKKRLEKKLYEYYRYLDSSLDALELCLNLNATEAIAKKELHQLNDVENKTEGGQE